MLSGWSTAGKLACPCCMEDTKVFTLKHGGKTTWFDCHRRFLPMDHEFRRNTSAFMKNRTDYDEPPATLSGEKIWERVKNFPKVTESPLLKLPGYGVEYNWTKQTIFWELLYWKHNLLRHNLDVMHIEKNFFDNLFHTIMDDKNRTKDNLKARMDLQEYCRRRELELRQENNRMVKPKAIYSFKMDDKRKIGDWVRNLRMPDGYASNLSNCVEMKEGKLMYMKSHDCHIFIESLLPIAFSALPERIWKPITEISLLFKDLCSNTLREENLVLMESNIHLIINKPAKCFPCGFFNVMEHLPVHLIREARLGGPVQCRWMYPFERTIGKCKRTVKQKSKIEGSICEAYLVKETSHFCSYYFEHHVPCLRNSPNRHDEGDNDPLAPPISIFNQPGRSFKKYQKINWTGMEKKSATTHVLLNCPEVQQFYE
ncbi:uncharacterized protein [Nicotiana tomentosiformis]|uniref:uncharacterized protein n=1 Tax=Nicotiana tomentosiformis TaxID=4098 RepID=UPI000878B021